MPLSNLRLLRDDMKNNEKAVVVFRFTYKSCSILRQFVYSPKKNKIRNPINTP